MCPVDSFEQEYYEKYYSNYNLQNPPDKLEFYNMLINRAADRIQQPRILEIGCAFGKLLSILNPDWHRYGLDISEYAIDKAHRLIPDAKLIVSSITNIPFKESFDVIVAFDSLEHIHDLEQAAQSVKSKIKKNGHFIFVVPVYDGLTGPLIRLLDKDTTHIHKKSRDFWIEWTMLNFKIDEWWGIYRYFSPGGHYLHITTKIFRRFTPAIAIVAHKI